MKLVAMFGIKYEPQWMVDDLIKNLKGWVDDFAIFDCRGRDELWIHEGYYRSVLREKAYQMKADWVLTTSPDERWEKDAGKVIRPLINDNKNKIIYENFLRELYDAKHYRIDGIWGNKYRRRLYPLYYREQSFANKPIQCPSPPQDDGYEVKRIDVNIYHLKMIEPENRKLRTKVFKKLDPTDKFQPGVGYDYLDDEDGIELQEIPGGREFSPKYRKWEFKVPKKYL